MTATQEDLRAVGCSAAKAAALLAVAAHLVETGLDMAQLELLPNEDVVAALMPLRGVGKWTATIVLLRGLGRLDVFPPADSGAARSLRGLFGFAPGEFDMETSRVLEILGPYKGMLYYHLLLWRLKTLGRLPESFASATATGPLAAPRGTPAVEPRP